MPHEAVLACGRRYPCYSNPMKSGSVRLPLICNVCEAKRNSLDETLIVYVWPVATLSNEKKPNELVVAILLKPMESVIDTVALRRPRPSDVSALPFTVASVSVAPDTTNGKSCLTSGAVSGMPPSTLSFHTPVTTFSWRALSLAALSP